MAKLWVGNIAPGVTEEELKAFLVKYGFPPFDSIEHVPGDGSRPAAVLSFEGCDVLLLQQLQPRVHSLYWKERRLNVSVITASRWGKE